MLLYENDYPFIRIDGTTNNKNEFIDIFNNSDEFMVLIISDVSTIGIDLSSNVLIVLSGTYLMDKLIQVKSRIKKGENLLKRQLWKIKLYYHQLIMNDDLGDDGNENENDESESENENENDNDESENNNIKNGMSIEKRALFK